ncbi:MAG: DUF6438 domain-containing protein [Polyangiaceae bacterium]
MVLRNWHRFVFLCVLGCTPERLSLLSHPSMRLGYQGYVGKQGTTATRPIAVDWEKAVLDGVIIRQIHGPCFGTCPAYSISIWGDGRIEYFGASQVLACGVRHKQIAMEDVRRLIDSARTSGFFWRDVEPDKLCDFWTDLPTVVTRIDMPGYGRAIEHSYGVRCFPEELQAFEDEIPRVAGVQEWTGTGDRLRFCDAVDYVSD